MWNDIVSLRTISHVLMWASGVFAIAAAGATGLRYYVDRRVGQLNEIARAEQEQKRIAAQAEGEANLRAQLQVTEEKLKDSGRKLSGLEERAQPRVFTASQRDRLLSFLKGKPSGRLVIKASITSPDARAYAEAIRDALAAGGRTVRIDNAMFAGSNTLGLWITVNNPATAPTAAGILQNALKTAGIEARGQYDTTRNVDDDELWLSVGNRWGAACGQIGNLTRSIPIPIAFPDAGYTITWTGAGTMYVGECSC